MQNILSLIAVSFLLTSCSNHPSDAQVRQLLPGTWSVSWGPGTHCDCTNHIGVDGRFLSRITYSNSDRIIEQEGVFQVRNGILIKTITKDSRPHFYDSPVTFQGRITKADSSEIIAEFSDGFQTAYFRKVTP